MDTSSRLAALLGGQPAEGIGRLGSRLTEIRLRTGAPVQLITGMHREWVGDLLSERRAQAILSNLLDYSHHAHQAELSQGFFTLPDGSRVGVCGKLSEGEGGRPFVSAMGSLCVRIARSCPGCADALFERSGLKNRPASLLIVSPPGLGKTTMLRELARLLSKMGRCVAIADERHELAACHKGVPTLDVGPCADVMDGGRKSEVIQILLRAMAPEFLVTDEIGSPSDAEALSDVRRYGVNVICSAHGPELTEVRSRPGLSDMLEEGIFDYVALLAGQPGRLEKLWKREGRSAWNCV